MDWIWEAVRTVLVGGLTIAVGAGLVWGAAKLRDAIFGVKPDFVMHRRGTTWTIERTKRRTAYALVRGTGYMGTSHASRVDDGTNVTHRFGDIDYREVRDVGEGDQMWFSWIDRRRLVSRTVDLTGDQNRVEVVGRRPLRNGSVTT